MDAEEIEDFLTDLAVRARYQPVPKTKPCRHCYFYMNLF